MIEHELRVVIRKRDPIVVIGVILMFLACIALIELQVRLLEHGESTERCFDGYHEEMTPQQVADLLHIPLPSLAYVPDDLHHNPEVTPFGWQDTGRERANCALVLVFGTDLRIMVYLQEFVVDNWSCGSAHQTPLESGFASACRGGGVSQGRGHGVTITSSTYPVDVLERIAEGLSLD